MKRGPQTDKEWEQYSSHNIDQLQELPMAELQAIKQVLMDIIEQAKEAMDSGEVPASEVDFEKLYLSVNEKRLHIVVVAIMKKIETVFKIPDFN